MIHSPSIRAPKRTARSISSVLLWFRDGGVMFCMISLALAHIEGGCEAPAPEWRETALQARYRPRISSRILKTGGSLKWYYWSNRHRPPTTAEGAFGEGSQ